jgi:serine phosphatase RsbU (regulator of sigma subunit)
MATARAGERLAGRPADGELLFQALFDANIIGVVIADSERVVDANDAFLRAAGIQRDDVDAGLVGWSHAQDAGGPVETTFTRPDGTVVPVLIGGATVQRTPFRMVAVVLDLSAPTRSLDRVTRLHGLASALSAALSADEVAEAIVSHGMDATGASCGVLGLPEYQELLLAHRHRFGAAGSAPPRLPRDADAPMPEAMRSGAPVLLDSRAAWLERFPTVPPRGDFEAFAAVPLMGERGAVGCLGFGFHEAREFAAADVELLKVVARQGAQALERAALYEQRAHVARTLQHGLLPTELPHVPGLQIATAYHSLGTGDEVGGDFYDVFATEHGWTAAIGDVCGQGVEAAVVTGMVRHTLRALELSDLGPPEVLARVNQAVRRHGPGDRFCSLVLVHLAASGGSFRADLGNAGHPPPMICRADGRVEEIDATGNLLGIADDMRAGAQSFFLEPGDALVLYTDGIVEARRDAELFGYERLAEALSGAAGQAAHQLTESVHAAVSAFAPGPPADDQALLVVRVDDAPAT